MRLLENGAHAVSLDERQIAVGAQYHVEIEARVLVEIDIGLRNDALIPDANRKVAWIGGKGVGELAIVILAAVHAAKLDDL